MLGRGRGGLETAAVHYHYALTAQGYEVVGVGHSDGWFRAQLPPNSAFIAAEPFSDYDPRVHFMLQGMVRRMAPDALVAHGNRAIRYGSRMSGTTRIGILHTLRLKPAIGRLDACVAVSEGLAIAARRLFPGMPIDVVPNLIDLRPDMARPQRRGPIVIGALGRLHDDKGFDIMIEALADERLRHRDWRLVIAGEGPKRAALQELVDRHAFTDRIRFAGWVQDRAAFFRSVDILCMPSRTESFGIVLIEALAHAIPVVASDNAGAREIITAGDDALVVPIGDPRALANAVAALLDDEPLALSLGRRGFEKVTERYSFDAVAVRLDKAVGRLAAAARSRQFSNAGSLTPEPAPAAPIGSLSA